MLALTASCSPQTAGAMKGHLTLITEFSDAQHLVAGHSVRIGDVQVGSVTKVALDGYRARVTMSIADGHRIPVGTVPQLALSSLLGENFIQLNLPPHFDPVHGPFLKSGTVLANGSSQAQLEDIAQQAITLFSAVSGGDLSTIVNSMAQAVNGRGTELSQVIAEFAQVSDVYANQSTNINAVIDGLAKLGASLGSHAPDIGTLIGNVSDATATMASQRDRLIVTLQRLTQLATSLDNHVLIPHADELRTLLAKVAPILGTVAKDKADLENLITNVVLLNSLLPRALLNRDLLLYAWFAGPPNGGRPTSAPLTGSQAITLLLAPRP